MIEARLIFLLPLLLFLSGCSTLRYYVQAIDGHAELLSKTVSIEELQQQTNISQDFKERLDLVKKIRAFASSQLFLPDNDSYRSIAMIERPYVVWSVVAAKPTSLNPEYWCFLFVGCTAYRGYFSEQQANEFSAGLSREGFDVYVGGVQAYSTLGWFNDPLPQNIVTWPDYLLAGLIFHELAHQIVYVEDDSSFNEAFATAVEETGVRRWLIAQGNKAGLQKYENYLNLKREFQRLFQKTRLKLEILYAGEQPVSLKLMHKQKIFNEFKIALQQHSELMAVQYKNWIDTDLNNARFALFSTYFDKVPFFLNLIDVNHGDPGMFYDEVKNIAKLPLAERIPADGHIRTTRHTGE